MEMGDVGVGLDTIKPIIRAIHTSPQRDELMTVAKKCKLKLLFSENLSLLS